MTYDIYRYIFIGAAILCGIMFVVSILVFIFLKIPKVISDLTGATARKAIKNIREQNEASGDKGYKVSAVNEARGRVTDKISPSGHIVQQHQGQMAGVHTSKIDLQSAPTGSANETTVLGAPVTNETTVLDAPAVNETTVLSQPGAGGETTVLGAESYPVAGVPPVAVTAAVDPVFAVEYEITYIHTQEMITEAV